MQSLKLRSEDVTAPKREDVFLYSAALTDVLSERQRQDAKWGVQNHEPFKWLVILGEEVGEACEATLNLDWNGYRHEMVQIAAVAIAAIEACDRADKD